MIFSPLLIACFAVLVGLVVLFWSASRFVEGSAVTARYLGMSPLLIGMIIIGFGTSAPEMVVSAFAAAQGNPGIALGNAYGSNITNIGLILGLTALLHPIGVHSRVLKRELPVLTAITFFAVWQIWDGAITRIDATILLIIFFGLIFWSIWQGLKGKNDRLGQETERELTTHSLSIHKGIFFLIVGLIFLIISSRILVWGAVTIAKNLGVSDLIIGLTVVAIGTSLPELASSVVASRKGEHDLALGNILGSNLFNTLCVVGIAGVIHPMTIASQVLHRDVSVMLAFTLALFFLCSRKKINRVEGGVLLIAYASYLTYLLITAF